VGVCTRRNLELGLEGRKVCQTDRQKEWDPKENKENEREKER
jgi:hypothetical protein